jgi:hypothetical protein
MSGVAELLKQARKLQDLAARARQLGHAFRLELDLARLQEYATELDAQALALEQKAALLLQRVDTE